MIHKVLSTGDDDSLHEIFLEDCTTIPGILTKDHRLPPLVAANRPLDFGVPSSGNLMVAPPLAPVVGAVGLSPSDLRAAPSLASSQVDVPSHDYNVTSSTIVFSLASGVSRSGCGFFVS